jgi:hypothetical protein
MELKPLCSSLNAYLTWERLKVISYCGEDDPQSILTVLQ